MCVDYDNDMAWREGMRQTHKHLEGQTEELEE